MKIHEYQAKEILKRYKTNVPMGALVEKKEDFEKIYSQYFLNMPVVVVKAQIHSGGRGKAGGVKVTKSKEDAKIAAETILGKTLVTHQTGPQGKKVLKIYLEQGINIKKEYYLSVLLDRSARKTIFMVSEEGGMDIEEVAEKSPEKIIKVFIESGIGLQPHNIRNLIFQMNIPKKAQKSFSQLVSCVYQAYIEEDLSMLEINPLILTEEDEFVVGDCKMDLDENALYRHENNASFRDVSEEDPFEAEASQYNLNYVKLDGNIGCMVNGAGLAMATMDLIKIAGAKPANFLDVGGGANSETVTNGFKIILKDKNVKGIFINIFGGIVRCDRVANGIIEAAKTVQLSVPVVVRLKGTNAKEAKVILEKSELQLIGVENLREATDKIAKLIQ